jgi:Mg2+/Co2+ transporter CorB
MDYVEKLSISLIEYDQNQHSFYREDYLEKIRQIGFLLNEIGGFSAMMAMYDVIEEKLGDYIASYLDPHWDRIGDWQY